MIYYALVFGRGTRGRCAWIIRHAALAGQISWILFLIGIVLLVIHLARRARVPIR
jgi:hypothetical protein